MIQSDCRKEKNKKDLGLVHLYHGDGKGKTTAAVGLAIRAAGCGKHVLFVQFMKGGQTGELVILGQIPNMKVVRNKPCNKFSFAMTEAEKAELTRCHNALLGEAIIMTKDGQYDLLVLDEAVGACAKNLLDEAMLQDFVQKKPETLELVLTGRNPSAFLLEAADYVTEMKKIKHPYEQGIPARVGIEK